MIKTKIKVIEDKWQNKWKESKTFEPKIEKKKEKYFATVPYPYANSVLHIGHGRAYTTADIYVRFQRLLGKNVLFPMGFHISGTPVLAVADGIKKGDAKQLKLTRDAISDYVSDKKEQDKIIESFKDPLNIAKYFSNTIQGSLDSIGISIDWTRQFTTGDKKYQKFVEWQFRKLKENNILIQGKYPILFSPLDDNAVGEDDIKDGDVEKVTIQEMTYILFKLKDKFNGNDDKLIAVATLRPDAIFGTTNLWVDKDMNLVEVRVKEKKNSPEQIWVVSKDSFNKLKYQFEKAEIIDEFKGDKLIGKIAVTPLINREVIIADANFIDPEHGTGIVYSSPAGSPHDYMALLEAKKEGRVPADLEVINTVETYDKKGNKITYSGSCPAEDKIKRYKINNSTDPKLEIAKQELYKEEYYSGKLNENTGEFNGLFIKNAKDKIKEKLVKENLAGTLYETSRKAITRNADKVIVANLQGQWFLDYRNNNIKEKAYQVLDNMTYYPNKLRATQKGYLDWVALRPCARKRGIGTPLPFDKNWVIESLSDSTIYQMLYLIINKINEFNIGDEKLTEEFFDYVLLDKYDVNTISKKLKIDKGKLEEIRKEVEYWKNVDFRYTASAHMSNHLSFMIYHYGLIFSQKNWPKNITIGGMLIKNGEKISKSKGNGIPLIRIKEKYGTDLYRLYIALASNYDSEMDFRDDDIFQLEKKFDKLKYLFENSKNLEKENYDNFSDLDKWLISKFYSRVDDYFKYMGDLRIREAFVLIIYEFLNDISYYQRRSSEKDTLRVLRFILEDYLLLITPAVPHITEEFNEKLGNSDFISNKKFSTNYKKYINKNLEEVEEIISNIITVITRTKEAKNLHQINSIKIIQANGERFKLFDTLKELLADKKNPKEIFSKLNSEFKTEGKFIKKFVPKTFGEGLSTYLEKNDEFKLIESIIPFLKKEFNVEDIEVIKNQEGTNLTTIPSKPQIIVE